MRIAVVSGIHGNRTAFEAVLADLRETSPDLIFHGGGLADGGSGPAEIVDRVRDLGWEGVLGNTDETHTRPDSLEEFASQSAAPPSLWAAVREMAAWTHTALGQERIAWLSELPRVQIHGSMALVHASPETTWHSPGREASDAELDSVYAPLGKPLAIYGHIHSFFARSLPGMIIANTGSVSLAYDGDPRAAYLLLDDFKPSIRRVEYDLRKEIRALSVSGLPHAAWIARSLESASPQMP
ncbi:MAG TPA: metallophosphoesterase family protein [Bryobacteraceae bacterium]|nr:metallophosphoesterase family protein [Bryobacteraceae bacterium]